MKEGPHASSNNPLVFFDVNKHAYLLPKMADEKIGTHVEAVNHSLKSYASNANIASPTSKIGRFVDLANERGVTIVDTLRLEIVRYKH